MFRFCLPALLLLPAVVFGDPKKPTYDEDVLPIVKAHCAACHGADKQKGGLNLATFAALKAGGSSGEVVVAGNPDKSRIYTLTTHKEEPVMPPSKQKIPDAAIEILRLWLEQGARENAGAKVVEKPKIDIGLKNVGKGKPAGPPPMPIAGKLKLDPLTKARRPGAVLAMASSPWAPLIAVGGQKQIILYHADTGDVVGVLPFDQGQINSLKFSRNGKLLLAAGGRGGASGKAVLYNVETGDKITEVGIETDALLSADISADQSLIAVGSPSKLIRIYRTADGSVEREIKKHTDWVTQVEFSPDGVLLATGDRNGGGFVWEANTGREFHTLRGHTGMITGLSWRDDSNILASSSEDGTIKLWEMENGGNIKNWAAHPGGAAAVHFGHDGRLASAGRDKIAKVWDGNGALQKQFEAFPDLGLQAVLTHDNTKIVAGDWSGLVKFWTIADAKLAANADTNPLPLAERIKLVEVALAAADAKLKTQQGALAGSDAKVKATQLNLANAQANVAKLTADIAAATKAVADTTAAANAAKVAVVPIKAEVDKFTAAAPMLGMVEMAKGVTVTAYAKASTEVAEAAKKMSANPMLQEQAKKAGDMLKVAQTELDAAKKVNADNATALAAANAKFAIANKVAVDSAAAQVVAAPKPALLQPVLVAAQAAIAPATAAVTAAQTEFNAMKPTVDAASAEFGAVKIRLDRVKGGVK